MVLRKYLDFEVTLSSLGITAVHQDGHAGFKDNVTLIRLPVNSLRYTPKRKIMGNLVLSWIMYLFAHYYLLWSIEDRTSGHHQ